MNFRPTTIVVGRNNAGKSTVVEALRLVAMIAQRYRHMNYSVPPRWTELSRRLAGVRPDLRAMGFNFETVFHRYGDPPAVVEARFHDGATIQVFVGGGSEVYGVVSDSAGNVASSKTEAKEIDIPPVSILPQIGPFLSEEYLLNAEYVRGLASSTLASRHFRNQLHIFSEHIPVFKELAESTWPGLGVGALDLLRRDDGRLLHLTIRDGDFATEIGWMGHGLQMWLQTMWVLSRVEPNGIVILDEPDVYMHADLQRRLIRLTRGRFGQVIIASHSVEIMSEVTPEDILVVDRKRSMSRFTTSLPGVQEVIERMGGVHNVHLARLASAKRFVLIEGDDLGLLSILHATVCPEDTESLGSTPHAEIGGWAGWQRAIGSSLVIQNTGDERIRVYCLLDRDSHR